jgi:GntR family histidine utilization transcriptional repressor
MTVNRALRELTAEGRLVRIQGVGTFVAAPKPVSPLVKIRSIDEEIREQGGRYSCRVLRLTREKASDRSAAAMNLESGAEVFHSILIHYGSGRPVQYSDRLVNPAVAPDYINQDFTTITPSRYLLETAPVTEAEHVIEALIPPEEVRDHLDMAAREPCLVLHRRTWTRRRVTTQSAFYYPGSRYRIGGRFSPSGGANLDVA